MKRKLVAILAICMVVCLSFGAFACAGTPNDKDHIHNFNGRRISNEYSASSATCEKKAQYYYSCDCGEKGTQTFESGDFGQHNNVDGTCTFCGEFIGTEGLIFELINNDTEYEVSDYTGSSAKVSIPATYNGKLVTSIGNNTFCNCSSLTSIIIPDSIMSIGEDAFSGCRSLQYNIKDGLKYLGNDNNKYLCLVGIVSTDITTVNIESNCKVIGDSALGACTLLRSIEIPDSVTSISDSAFAGCFSLTNVTIPDSVTSIGDSAFAACRLKSITIPDSVTSIGRSAFIGCSSLETIIIPNNVIFLGEEAFLNCTSIKTIYCEAESQPSGWGSYWDKKDRKDNYHNVVWGYKG